MQVYLVGGAVRDELLDRNVTERDWVVVGTTAQTMLNLSYSQVGKDFPVFLHPQTKEEYALARTERKSGTGYTGFVCDADSSVTLEDDLLRRDLTINAMAKSADGEIIDPYGGLTDLKNKCLRHVSDAFVEDPLRVLRVARFAARYAYMGFEIAPDTMALMQRIAHSGELENLSAQRVWQETRRALAESSPSVYFTVLQQSDAMGHWFKPLSNDATFSRVLQQLDSHCATLPDAASRLAYLAQGLSAEMAESMCKTLTVPNQVAHLVTLVCRYRDLLSLSVNLSADSLLTLFNGIDVWRKPAFLPELLKVFDAIWQDEVDEMVAQQRQQTILRAADAAAKVDVQEIIANGFKGPQIREQLLTIRHQRLEQVIANP